MPHASVMHLIHLIYWTQQLSLAYLKHAQKLTFSLQLGKIIYHKVHFIVNVEELTRKTECLIGCRMVLSIWVVYHCDCVADMPGSGSLLLGGSIVLLIASLKKVRTQNLKYGFYWVISLMHCHTVKNLSVEP